MGDQFKQRVIKDLRHLAAVGVITKVQRDNAIAEIDLSDELPCVFSVVACTDALIMKGQQRNQKNGHEK